MKEKKLDINPMFGIDDLINRLDTIARDNDLALYGLPIYDSDSLNKMRAAVIDWRDERIDKFVKDENDDLGGVRVVGVSDRTTWLPLNKHRSMNDRTIWLPFPIELENSVAIINLSSYQGNQCKIYSLNYYAGPVPAFREYNQSEVVSFTLSESDVSFTERVSRVKGALRDLLGELRSLVE